MMHSVTLDHSDSRRVAGPGLLSRLLAAVRQARMNYRAQMELASLSDRELADIGVSRSEIRDAVRLHG